MEISVQNAPLTFQRGDRCYAFLQSGDVRAFTQGPFLINGYVGTQKEGSQNNLYLRVLENGRVTAFAPLLGIHSQSRVSYCPELMRFSGECLGIPYTVDFFPGEGDVWLWGIELDAGTRTVDVVYGQDIGVGSRGGVLTNELYLAQYLGHTILETENGFAVASRQNQPQDGCFPFLQQGIALGRAVHFSTDGIQFFGLSYKETDVPQALSGDLCDVNRQFELSYTALQSQPVTGKAQLAFYGLFLADHPEKVTGPRGLDQVARTLAAYQALRPALVSVPPVALSADFGPVYVSPEMADEALLFRYPGAQLKEEKGGRLLSFFTPDHAHVVTRRKELLCERPHGSIITTLLNLERVDENLLTSTNSMYGLFNAQTVVGNTTLHKLISTQRGLLNVLKNHGQRLYVKIDGVYRLLTLPAAYEMGMNYSRWLYRVADDVLRVTVYASSQAPDITLEIQSEAGLSYDVLFTAQLVLGDMEFDQGYCQETLSDSALRLTPCPAIRDASPYPDLAYDLVASAPVAWSDDRVFFADSQPRNTTLLTARAQGSALSFTIHAHLYGPEPRPNADFETEKAAYLRAYQDLTANFRLRLPGREREAEKLNALMWWYAHNALTHFAVPHGLEQPGGAAWGTRDVSQGSFEFLMTAGKYALARDMLIHLFAHQLRADGQWPQWFMFDRYQGIYAHECHGDVVFWPLKCLAEYVRITGDRALLAKETAFLDDAAPAPVLDHVRLALGSIRGRFLPGTHLVSYAGGDWDDTLQPVQQRMRDHLVSAWTQALAYQVLTELSQALADTDTALAGELKALAAAIGEDFNHCLIQDGVIAGFALREENGALSYLLHPSDDVTGIQYRLLPLTRSIIAGLASPAQAEKNTAVIREHLACPDGVRLMNRPTRYDGGVSHLFIRAEQAANVGREISLQYVHAHIRYIEAMARLGRAEDAWRGLFAIVPIGLTEVVKNAEVRQSNLYFSSSDGAFADRDQFQREFSRLREGSIAVKGGWRLYSSGPGIFMHQLVASLLGIRPEKEGLVLDPVLPKGWDGLELTYRVQDRPMTFTFRAGEVLAVKSAAGAPLATLPLADNPYRPAGIRLSWDALPADGRLLIIYPLF